MNKQKKFKAGKLIGRGIEWTDYTWNFIAGCRHACRWQMPDGTIAECYAKAVSEGVARRAYPAGFEAHYYRPDMLRDPFRIKEPAKIFLDSMSDLMGHWVPENQINQVLDVCRQAHWHTFQLLTKNATRILKFNLPANVWVGASSPPDFMWGRRLNSNQRARMLDKALQVLSVVDVPVRWMSIEPLSWDIARIVEDNEPLQWAVIGAATNGRKVYQPEPGHVARLLEVFDRQNVPVFFKGNIRGNPGIDGWREWFPGFERSEFMETEAVGGMNSKLAQLAMVF